MPSTEQMNFVWAYYPQYSGNPHTILDWLQEEARRLAPSRSSQEEEKEKERLNEARRRKEAAEQEVAAANREIAAIEAQKQAAIKALPTKGKPASFFQPTQE